MTSNPPTIPSFDSNSSYLVLSQRRFTANLLVNMTHGKYQELKAYFWVGSRCTEYDRNFQETVNLIGEIQEHLGEQGKTSKVRYLVEFHYTESLSFFELFKRNGARSDLAIERC